MGTDIFDIEADGDALVATAVEQARITNRRVLVLLGANWCPYCRRLHHVVETSPAVTEMLRDNLELVHVDVNTRRTKSRNAAVVARLGNPLRFGLPVFVVLEADGTLLTTRETGSLAASTDEELAERLVDFLNEWVKPAPRE